MKNKFLAVDDDGVAGVVSSGVTGYDREVLRQHVDDLPLAFIAPLGAYDHRSLAFFQFQLRQENFQQAEWLRCARGRTHSLPRRDALHKKLLGYVLRRCVQTILSRRQEEWQRMRERGLPNAFPTFKTLR